MYKWTLYTCKRCKSKTNHFRPMQYYPDETDFYCKECNPTTETEKFFRYNDCWIHVSSLKKCEICDKMLKIRHNNIGIKYAIMEKNVPPFTKIIHGHNCLECPTHCSEPITVHETRIGDKVNVYEESIFDYHIE